jgi:hypothetical protein
LKHIHLPALSDDNANSSDTAACGGCAFCEALRRREADAPGVDIVDSNTAAPDRFAGGNAAQRKEQQLQPPGPRHRRGRQRPRSGGIVAEEGDDAPRAVGSGYAGASGAGAHEQSGGIALPPVLALDMHGLLTAVPVSRTFVYEEIKKGRLVARKLGKRTIFLIEDVRSWLRGFGGQDESR